METTSPENKQADDTPVEKQAKEAPKIEEKPEVVDEKPPVTTEIETEPKEPV
jgi:hypothetical protein